jgi:hypothetical protein|tara:strand:+ start:664 stop:1587 length:924 start_codon:yes stop_codon:yes gene_type:complete
MSKLLTENALAPTKTDAGTWRAVLITPGKGSSGIYTETMLAESGPTAFPKGTHSYVDHPVSEGDIRSPKNLMGVLAEDAYYEDGVGLVAELQVMPHWKDFVEAVAPHTGLSIYAMGQGDYNADGELVVESLTPNTQNSVDLVSYAGRAGSGLAEKLYESALAAFDSSKVAATAETVPPIEEGMPNMDEVKEMFAELDAKFTALMETLTPAEVEAVEEEEVDVTAVAETIAEAMVAANLPEVSRKAVYESLRNGVDVTVAIEGQKAFVESVTAHIKETAKVNAVDTVIIETAEAKKSLRAPHNMTKVG